MLRPIGVSKPASDPPIPVHLKKTKMVIDFVKYVAALVVGIAALGWMGHGYISQFQTTEQAQQSMREVTVANDLGHAVMQEGIEANGEAIGSLRVYNIRIELEQRSSNDRLDQLIYLQRAKTRSERLEANRRVDDLQRRIERRERVIRNPVALRRILEAAERNPLEGLNGL